ncbi:MAG: hypothetical protein ABEJ36_00900 [Candidatus Nanosalina sp.]
MTGSGFSDGEDEDHFGLEEGEGMLESDAGEANDGGLDYDEVLEEFSEDFRGNFEDNVAPTGAGIESEVPIVRREDGVMPLSPEYQQILSEGLWESIEDELEENVDGYGDDFRFELKDIKEKGHFEDLSAEMAVEASKDSEDLIDSPAMDWEIGPQIEIDSGAFQLDGSGNFGILLDVLTSVKEGTRKYLRENHPELEFADQGLTRQFRVPGEVPDEAERLDGEGVRRVIKRGIGEEFGRDEAVEFSDEFYDHFSSIEYCADYIGTIFGPQIMENMFGGATQLTSGLWQEDGEDIDLDERVGEEIAYRIVFEGAFDVLTSSVYREEDGEKVRQVGVNQDYWENSAYGQHFLDDADVDEEALDRTGTPWGLLESVADGGDMGEFRSMVDHYMTQHNMAWIAPPDQEHVEFDGELPNGFEYGDVTLLTVDPEDPKTPREYIEEGEVGFTKVVRDGSGGLNRVTGTVDLSGMDEEEAKEYHRANFEETHIGGMHHDVRPKFGTGGFEYRNSRQNYEDEPSVAIAKAAIMPHGDKIVDALESRGINPADPETVPDYDNEEVWTEIFSDVYDDEVMETAEAIAPEYADDFKAYVEERLPGPEVGKDSLNERVV